MATRWPVSSHHSENKEPVSSLQEASSPGHSTWRTTGAQVSERTDGQTSPPWRSGGKLPQKPRPQFCPSQLKAGSNAVGWASGEKTYSSVGSLLQELDSPRARQELPGDGKPGSELAGLYRSPPLNSGLRCQATPDAVL